MLRKAWIFGLIALLALVHTPWALLGMLLWPTRTWRARVATAYARLFSRQVLALAGVRWTVSGAEHLRTAPAVFLFNHVNNVDFFLNAAIAPPHAVVFGKRELAWVPLVGWVWWLSGHPLIRRQDRAHWQRVMDRVEQRLREDRAGAWLAPEGTRSRDGRLLPFKKGPFQLALKTGAPVVPVVIHGARALAGPGGVQPGRVRLEVLPPIPTVGWRAETLDAHVEAVRGVYLNALGDGTENRNENRERE